LVMSDEKSEFGFSIIIKGASPVPRIIELLNLSFVVIFSKMQVTQADFPQPSTFSKRLLSSSLDISLS